jgi:hypothetical protein
MGLPESPHFGRLLISCSLSRTEPFERQGVLRCFLRHSQPLGRCAKPNRRLSEVKSTVPLRFLFRVNAAQHATLLEPSTSLNFRLQKITEGEETQTNRVPFARRVMECPANTLNRSWPVAIHRKPHDTKPSIRRRYDSNQNALDFVGRLQSMIREN